MRIAMISEHASPLAVIGGVDAGGQNVHVAALSAALARRGHSVVVYTRRDDERLPDRVPFAPGVEVVHVTAGPARSIGKDDLLPHMGELAEGVCRDWRHGVPDVVHGHFWMSGVAALDAVRAIPAGLARPAVLQTFHALGSVKRRFQGAADTSPPQRSWLEPAIARRVDRVVATCPDEVAELILLGADPGRVSVAPCGVDLGLFTGAEEPEPTNGRRRITVVGRLVERKGVDLVIRALRVLADSGVDDVDVYIVGGSPGPRGLDDDPEVRRLRGIADELGLTDRVIFRGQLRREAMPAMLRSSTAVVCSPWYEPFGIVPLEAMASGVPVVVSAVGGLQDSVVDEVTGLQVPPRDHLALAAALQRLLDDPALVRRLGRAGRKRAEKEYSWERVAALTENAYLRTLGCGSSEPAVRPLTYGGQR